mmetsp:Transcript_10103/g.28245  ORF Transcript_10103/g.28245 Transcript_10103/m.28245 type:complete len:332 (+) Transcript_10103:128-1123(+)
MGGPLEEAMSSTLEKVRVVLRCAGQQRRCPSNHKHRSAASSHCTMNDEEHHASCALASAHSLRVVTSCLLPHLANHDDGNAGATTLLCIVYAMEKLRVNSRVKCEYVAVLLRKRKFSSCFNMSESEVPAGSKRGTGRYIKKAAPPQALVAALVVMVEAQANAPLVVHVDPPRQKLRIDAHCEVPEHEGVRRQLLAVKVLHNLAINESAPVQPRNGPFDPRAAVCALAPGPESSAQLAAQGFEEPQVARISEDAFATQQVLQRSYWLLQCILVLLLIFHSPLPPIPSSRTLGCVAATCQATKLRLIMTTSTASRAAISILHLCEHVVHKQGA